MVYCPVKRASAPSILTQWSFQMLKGGEGVVVVVVEGGGWGRVGWDGGGGGGGGSGGVWRGGGVQGWV